MPRCVACVGRASCNNCAHLVANCVHRASLHHGVQGKKVIPRVGQPVAIVFFAIMGYQLVTQVWGGGLGCKVRARQTQLTRMHCGIIDKPCSAAAS